MQTRDEISDHAKITIEQMDAARATLIAIQTSYGCTALQAAKMVCASPIDDARVKTWRFRLTIWDPRGDLVADSAPERSPVDGPAPNSPLYLGLEAVAKSAAQMARDFHHVDDWSLDATFLSRLQPLRQALHRNGGNAAQVRVGYAIGATMYASFLNVVWAKSGAAEPVERNPFTDWRRTLAEKQRNEALTKT